MAVFMFLPMSFCLLISENEKKKFIKNDFHVVTPSGNKNFIMKEVHSEMEYYLDYQSG